MTICYAKCHISDFFREETQTDDSCSWNQPSKKALALYKQGIGFDEIRGHKPKFVPHDFAPMTKEAREEQRKFMEAAGNTKPPLYKHVCLEVCQMLDLSNFCTILGISIKHFISEFVYVCSSILM